MASIDESSRSNSAMVLGRRTASIASSLFITKALTFLVMGLAFILIVRLLGPASYGIYTLALATAGFFGALGDMGVSTAFIKLIPQYMQKKNTGKIRSLLANGFVIMVIESGVFTILAFALSGFVAQNVFHAVSDTLALQLVSFTIILSVVWVGGYSTLIALGRGGSLAKAVSIQVMLQASISLALALLQFGAIAPIIGLLVSYLGGAAYSISASYPRTQSKEKTVVSTAEWKKLLSFSLPIGISSALNGVSSTLVANISIIILGFYSTALVLGNFGAAYKAISLFDVLLGSIGLAILPFFSVALSSKKITRQINKYYNYSIYFALLFAAPIIFYIVFLSQPFSYTLFGATYSAAPLYMAIMAIGTLLIVVNTYTTNLLIGAGKVGKVLKYNLIVAAVQLLLVWLVVPNFAGLGLVLLMFIVMPLLSNVLFLNRAKISFNASLEYGTLGKVLLSALISALLTVPLQLLLGSNSIPLLIASAALVLVVYPVIISLLKGVDRERLSILNRVTRGLPVFGQLMRLLTGYTSIFLR